MQPWELEARELIRDTLAQYNWSGDAFRLDEMAGAFTPDGVLELRTGATCTGRTAIVEFLSGGVRGDTDDERRAARLSGGPSGTRPGPVRHALTNTRFVSLTPDAARVESYFTVFTDIGLDHYGRYRDRFVPTGGRWLIAHRLVSTDWRSPDSTMAGPSSVS